MIELRLLGGFSLVDDGEQLELQPASQRLVAFLALAPAAVERAFTAFRLWPESTEDRARGNLRTTVWRLNRDRPSLVSSSRTHVWIGDEVWVDVVDALLEECVDVGELIAPRLHEDLLPDWYDGWLDIERERMRQLRLHALEDRARRALQDGAVGSAVQLALRAIAIDVLRESAHRLVIEAHIAEGNIADAVRQYDRCSQALEEELGVEPSPALRDLLPSVCIHRTRERRLALQGA
jgi:DNA-binding SARP family transcriptional activator